MLTRLLSPLLLLMSFLVLPSTSLAENKMPLQHEVTSPTGYVYVGSCDNAVWRDAKIAGLPACTSALPAEGIVATANEGLKVRAGLPTKATGFATEIARLHTGQHIKVLSLHNTTLGDGPGTYWAKVIVIDKSPVSRDARPTAVLLDLPSSHLALVNLEPMRLRNDPTRADQRSSTGLLDKIPLRA